MVFLPRFYLKHSQKYLAATVDPRTCAIVDPRTCATVDPHKCLQLVSVLHRGSYHFKESNIRYPFSLSICVVV